jgi:hypothetical protein
MAIFEVFTARRAQHLIDIPEIPAVIAEFVKSGEKLLLASAANLLKFVLPNSPSLIYHEALTQLFEIFCSSKSDMESSLSFVKAMVLDGCAEIIPELTAFLVAIDSHCQKHPSLFSEYCAACIHSLGIESFPVLWQWRDKLSAPQNAVLVIEAAQSLPAMDVRVLHVCELCFEAKSAVQQK